jgi:hypothetical protein
MKRLKYVLLVLIFGMTLQACVVLAVADLAATAVVKTAGLAVDGVVGTVKVVGNVIMPSDDKDKDKEKE